MTAGNADKSAKPDESAKAASPAVSSPDELVKDLDVKVSNLSQEEQNKITGGCGTGMSKGF